MENIKSFGMQDRFQPSEHVIWKRIDGGIVIVDLKEGDSLTFNNSGAILWELITEKSDFTSMKDALSLSGASDPEKDLSDYLSDLFESRIIEKILS
jgi:hypothetical protein